MRGDDSRFEYPDTAGYPDGMGTLHEGIDDGDENAGDEDENDEDDGSESGDENDEAATAAEGDVERFARDDEEDDEGV